MKSLTCSPSDRDCLYLQRYYAIIFKIWNKTGSNGEEPSDLLKFEEKVNAMFVLYVILLAVIQGILEFLPVSSFGHLCVIQELLGMERGPGVLLEVMLHFGTLAAVILTFRKDIIHLAADTLEMIFDIVGNISLYIHNRRSGEDLHYAKIISTTYRKFSVLLLVSMIPTIAIGFTARRLVALAAASRLIPGAGILITGVLLLVVDLSGQGGNKAARDAHYGNAMWIGICQGLAVFPGLSRSGLTISAGLFGGFSRTFAVKYSYILSIPAIVGALIVELGEFGSPEMTVGMGFTYVLGMIISAVVGYFVIRFLLKLVQKGKLRNFAFYCFLAGFLSLLAGYLTV